MSFSASNIMSKNSHVEKTDKDNLTTADNTQCTVFLKRLSKK